MYIYSHNPDSEGARALAEALDVKRIRHENSRFRGAEDKIVINWGASRLPDAVEQCRVINKSFNVNLAADKLRFFDALSLERDVRTVPSTTERRVVADWLKEGATVFARAITNGTNGEGITEFDALVEEIPVAPLYTKYVKKQDEYRIHIGGGNVISSQRKALRTGHVGDANHHIRNLANGFVFVRNDLRVPDDVMHQAAMAVYYLGLDFGAVDVIWNERSQKAWVVEVNTAPGLEGTTVTDYANYFNSLR